MRVLLLLEAVNDTSTLGHGDIAMRHILDIRQDMTSGSRRSVLEYTSTREDCSERVRHVSRV